jgi:hypothetical protein
MAFSQKYQRFKIVALSLARDPSLRLSPDKEKAA